jgi:hypothetical protein
MYWLRANISCKGLSICSARLLNGSSELLQIDVSMAARWRHWRAVPDSSCHSFSGYCKTAHPTRARRRAQAEPRQCAKRRPDNEHSLLPSAKAAQDTPIEGLQLADMRAVQYVRHKYLAYLSEPLELSAHEAMNGGLARRFSELLSGAFAGTLGAIQSREPGYSRGIPARSEAGLAMVRMAPRPSRARNRIQDIARSR